MKRRLVEMTWPEVADAVENGSTTVVFPLGATEQHGPHLPLGTDAFRAEALADRLAACAPPLLVAPTLPVGCSDEHHGFAGLLSVDHDTLTNVIVDCARRMTEWGVCRLVLLSAHGGNARALDLAAARLAGELPKLDVVVVLGLSTSHSRPIQAVASEDGISLEAVGLHAGEGETSEMLALRPDLVNLERAAHGHQGSLAELMPQLERAGVRSVAPNGILGDARPADAERGARYIAAHIESFRHVLADNEAPQ